MAPSTTSAPSLPRDSLYRQSSAIRTGCANERPSGSVRGVSRTVISLPGSSTFLVTFLFLSNPEGEVRKYLALSPLGATQRLSRLTLQRDVFHNRERLARVKTEVASAYTVLAGY